MKKIYEIPAISVTRLLTETVVATSLVVDDSKETGEQYVKGNTSSRSDSNVWDDDWSR